MWCDDKSCVSSQVEGISEVAHKTHRKADGKFGHCRFIVSQLPKAPPIHIVEGTNFV